MGAAMETNDLTVSGTDHEEAGEGGVSMMTNTDFVAAVFPSVPENAMTSTIPVLQPSAPPSNETKPMTTPATLAAPTLAPFDFNAMRLPANYGETLGVKKVLTMVPVGKPDKARFFRIRGGAEWVFAAYILQNKEADETYIVLPHIAPIFGSLARPAQLHVAVGRNGNPSLVPVVLPGEDGKRNSWHESLAQAVELAETQWIRIVSNMPAGAYDVLVATGNLSGPVWPDTSMEELIKVAFRGKIIDSESHPVVQALLGAV